MRTVEEDRDHVIANATHWTAVAYRGRGEYVRLLGNSLVEARELAARIHKDRPVMIYAVAYNLDGSLVRQVHVENWSPRSPK